MKMNALTIRQVLKIEYMPVLLIALMLLTRFHHFGDAMHLPDASLAVFFLAGFCRVGFYGGYRLLAFLLILAGLIDYVAIANGTSGWCVTPAYIFMIPTYCVMWLAGRRSSQQPALGMGELAFSLALAILATSLAFIISNASFYLFSGRYANLASIEYIFSVTSYLPLYLLATLGYIIVGLTIAKMLSILPIPSRQHKPV